MHWWVNYQCRHEKIVRDGLLAVIDKFWDARQQPNADVAISDYWERMFSLMLLPLVEKW
jgi:hypothetical protein